MNRRKAAMAWAVFGAFGALGIACCGNGSPGVGFVLFVVGAIAASLTKDLVD